MVGTIFNFLNHEENLLREFEHNRILSVCQNLYKIVRDVYPLKVNDELERFCGHRMKKQRNAVNNFLTYISFKNN